MVVDIKSVKFTRPLLEYHRRLEAIIIVAYGLNLGALLLVEVGETSDHIIIIISFFLFLYIIISHP